MRRTVLGVLVVIFALGLMLSSGCKSSKPQPDDSGAGTPASRTGDCQTCADNKRAGHGWCDSCSSGYAENSKTSCPICAKAGKFDEGCAASHPKVCSECTAKLK